VDCAFFLNDFFKPAELKLPKYVVLAFDKRKEPNLNLDCELIVRAHNKPVYDVPKEALEKPNILISDSARTTLTFMQTLEASIPIEFTRV